LEVGSIKKIAKIILKVEEKLTIQFHRKSGGGFSMSTVVIFKEIVFSSANKYRSMKYSYNEKLTLIKYHFGFFGVTSVADFLWFKIQYFLREKKTVYDLIWREEDPQRFCSSLKRGQKRILKI